MIAVLDERIAQMKSFDTVFVGKVTNLREDVEALDIVVKPEDYSDDKSVRSHVRKQQAKAVNILNRFKRDIQKLIDEMTDDEMTDNE